MKNATKVTTVTVVVCFMEEGRKGAGGLKGRYRGRIQGNILGVGEDGGK